MGERMADAKTFVLVHGAWHGGWCWRRVADLLAKRGHTVFAPTLTGLGAASHLLSPSVGLDTHIADVANLIRWERLADIVLVGHSYGGFVISGVAEQAEPAIGAIVYLDAFVPEDGHSMAENGTPATRERVRLALERGEDAIPPRSAESFNVNAADRAWIDALCTPQPLGCFLGRLTLTGARERIARKAYIRATAYPNPMFDQAAEMVKARQGWTVHGVPCGHDVMVDMPDRLAALLEEVG